MPKNLRIILPPLTRVFASKDDLTEEILAKLRYNIKELRKVHLVFNSDMRENYNLLLPLARFGQLAKCVQCYIGQICPSIHWTDLAIDKWHNMSTHRKDLILLFLLPSSFSPPPPPSLSPPLSLSDLLHATVISLQYYFTYITFYLITFELSEI